MNDDSVFLQWMRVEIDEPGLCEDCAYDASICKSCDGTGEGCADGVNCPECKGKGVILRNDFDDFYSDEWSEQ